MLNMSEKCSGQCQSSSTNEDVKIDTQLDNYSGAFVSTFKVPQMDCPSEERLIRLALDSIEPSVGLQFDIPSRLVKVFHDENLDEITKNYNNSISVQSWHQLKKVAAPKLQKQKI
tara:strand:+ start:181 stop:525 length:345 start_codon:yes stop_codon:yes gene_type:complete